MRGSDRRDEFVTTDLLSAWTDPVTTMEAVGASLGVFDVFGDRVAHVRRVLATESPLRNALSAVLLRVVDGGALETRACGDGQYAFRWREDGASAGAGSPEADKARLLASLTSPRRESPTPTPTPPPTPPPPTPVVEAEVVVAPRPARVRRWPRLVAPTAPLVLPALSCVLALLAFVWLDRSVALVIAAALTLAGVVGLVRRVPFAGLWTVGVVVATVLLRFS